jgi:predicted TIM-barrel fold metal-dependent hydrolase
LPELIELVQAFPGTKVICCHTGGPVGLGRFKGTHAERFPIWRESIRTLAKSPNVYMKLGGLGMPSTGFKTSCNATPPRSEALAQEWKPYIETCIEAFGAERCMFESNFPPDKGTAGYATTWNAFKRTVSGASAPEKAALFGGTAKRVYNLDVDLT